MNSSTQTPSQSPDVPSVSVSQDLNQPESVGGPESPLEGRRPGRKSWDGEPLFGLVLLVASIWIVATLSVIGFNAPPAPESAEARQLDQTIKALTLEQQTPMAERPWPPALAGAIEGSKGSKGSEEFQRPQTRPAVTWLQMVMAPRSPSGEVEAARLARRSRMASTALLLLTLAGVGWTGFCLGRLALGGAAVLVVSACPWMLVSGIIADGTMLTTALTSAAIACGVWAMRPLRSAPPRPRQMLGFAACGLFGGGQALAGGPEALTLVVGPLLVLGVTCPRRNGHLLGGIAAAGLATLVIMAWVATLAQQDVRAAEAYVASWTPSWRAALQTGTQTFLDHGQVWWLAWLPWTLWLVAAFLQPFSTSSRDSYRRLLAGWGTMLITVLAVATMENSPTPRQLMTLSAPGVSLALGQVFARYIELSAEGRHARLWRLLKWPHVLLVFVGSLAVAWTFMQPSSPENWWSTHPAYFGALSRRGTWLEPVSTWLAVSSGLLLLLIATLMARFTWREHPGRALAAYAAWWMAAAMAMAVPISTSPAVRAPGPDTGSHEANWIQKSPVSP